ncbi:Alanine--tRNA ligase, cytoplasmic [Araneus ventricosus]|uniref:alanine--tRNA ligase n=1 Tax=Araneus ventricosus TaxID=182803 RepID=A0A4Y2L846_ARAVE|nr:Alanine--tRNA ligase, cytoplasmic [Araneus ventricosus]
MAAECRSKDPPCGVCGRRRHTMLHRPSKHCSPIPARVKRDQEKDPGSTLPENEEMSAEVLCSNAFSMDKTEATLFGYVLSGKLPCSQILKNCLLLNEHSNFEETKEENFQDLKDNLELKLAKVPAVNTSPKYLCCAVFNDKEPEFETCSNPIPSQKSQRTFVEKIENEQECGVNLDRSLFYAEPGEHIYDIGSTIKENEKTTKFAVKEVYHQEGKTIKPSTEFTEKEFANVSQANDYNSKVYEVSFNEEVSAERTPLPNLKGVQGWRGVLGKMCPDPVWVESIGISVGDLLPDTSGSGEMIMSPEFCGKIHLEDSSPFGHFIIFSEEATAKEKRRIAALVDSEATKAIRRSELFQDKMKNKLMDFKKKLEDLDSAKNVAIVQLIEEVKILLAENLANLVSGGVNRERKCSL